LIKIAEENPNCHFFMDEVLVDNSSIPTRAIQKMSEIVSEKSYFWIACQSDKKPYENDKNLAGFQKNHT
jgi:hypothetical protein